MHRPGIFVYTKKFAPLPALVSSTPQGLWTTASECWTPFTTVDHASDEATGIAQFTIAVVWHQVKQEAIINICIYFVLKPEYLYRGASRVQKSRFFTQPGGFWGFIGFSVLLGFSQVFFISMCSVKKYLAEKWKLNLLTDLLTLFKICSRFYFANSLFVELKALNIIMRQQNQPCELANSVP